MKGLSTIRAETLLKQYGLNEIPQTGGFGVLKSFVSQFSGFLMLLLIASGVISWFIGETIDAVFIFLIILLNALFGFYQEFKAEQSLKALKEMTTTMIRVIRDGQEQEVDSRYLVPGDLIYLEQGTKIPADATVVESHGLHVNEAAMTGESLPVEKEPGNDEKNQLFMGTMVTGGRGYATITGTGVRTGFGKIAVTLSGIEKSKTPMQKKLDVFTKQIGFIGIAAALIVFGLSFLQEKTLTESFIFAVSLAVAAVPEGLPAVMTITLAIGVERMAKRKAIVRKLNAIETLGSVTLLATDKTGTLTTNKMRVNQIWVDDSMHDISQVKSITGDTVQEIFRNGILCSTASLVYKEDHGSFDVLGDTTEGALLIMAHEAGIDPMSVRTRWQLVEEYPFDQDTKKMMVVAQKDKLTRVYVKGAPESVLSSCSSIMKKGKVFPLSESEREKIKSGFLQCAGRGLRMLAFSYDDSTRKAVGNNQIFLGFVGMSDPVRPQIKEAVSMAHLAGIRVVMITGDNEMTARAVGLETGIISEGDDILNGQQLNEFSDTQLLELLPKVTIFARTTPEHKHKLVRLYQKLGHIVAVTGDGVNDALAIKQADVGVAMGITGTDVAKETADIVITDDNFASLVNAVEEGRNIFNRIRNAIKFLLACNLGEVIYILSATVFGWPVITPLQILYMNLVTDGLPAISLAFSPRDRDIMRQKPKADIAILGENDFRYLLAVGLLTALLCYISIVPFMSPLSRDVAVTVLFTTMIFVQHFILLNAWLSHRSIIGRFATLKHAVFLAAFFIPIVIHPFLLYLPGVSKVLDTVALGRTEIIYAVTVSLLMFIILEASKLSGRSQSSQGNRKYIDHGHRVSAPLITEVTSGSAKTL